MKFRKIILIMPFIALLLLPVGCGRSEKPEPQTAVPAVATIDGQTISVTQLNASLEDRPLGPTDADVAGAVRNRLDALVLDELLFQKALAEKLDQDPEVKTAVRRLLIRKLLETRVEKPVRTARVDEDEVKAYYEAHRHEFERPEQVRAADIFIAVPQNSGGTQRKDLRQKAEDILAQARVSKHQRGAFSELTARLSDTPALYPKGDTGFFDQTGGPKGLDPAVVRAVFAIEKNGDLAPGVVEAGDGFHIVMRIAKRSAVHTPLSKVKHRLEMQIKKENLASQREMFLSGLKEKATVSIHEQALAGVVKDMDDQIRTRDQLKKNRIARSMKGNTPPVFEVE